MNYPSSSRWTDRVWRSALTLVAASLAIFVARQLLSVTWPFLLVLGGVLLVIRIAVGAVRGRSEW